MDTKKKRKSRSNRSFFGRKKKSQKIIKETISTPKESIHVESDNETGKLVPKDLLDVSSQNIKFKKESMQVTHKRHPLQKAGLISKLFFLWVNKPLKLQKKLKGEFKQEDHYDLPTKDLISKNYRRIAKNFFRHAKGKSMSKTLLRTYSCQSFGLTLIIILYAALNFSTAYILSKVVEEIQSKKDFKKWENIQPILIYFSAIIGAFFFSSVLYNYSLFQVTRLSYRLRSSLMTIIFEKMLKRNSLNPSSHSEGQIVNYIQVDCMKYEQSLLNVINIVNLSVSFVIGNIYIWFLLKWTVFAMFVAYLLAVLIFTLFYIVRAKVTKLMLEAKDQRINMLKNMVNNIKYIKMRAWELFYHYKLYFEREKEIKRLFQLAWLGGGAVFINWFVRSLALVAVLFFKTYFNSDKFTYIQISAFLRVFDLIRAILLQLPWNINYLVDLNVSNNRIKKYLNSDEIDNSWIEERGTVVNDETDHESYMGSIYSEERGSKIDPESNYAFILENGYFEWNKKIVEKKNTEEEEEKEEKKKKTNVSIVTVSKSGRDSLTDKFLSGHTASSNDTRSRILNQISEEEKNISFRLIDINMKIPKGKLIFVIGKVGSGKSSLLYSILGEMKMSTTRRIPMELPDEDEISNCELNLDLDSQIKAPHDPRKQRLIRNGSVVLLSERPWLMPKSIKENITLNKKFNLIRMMECIKMAQFDHDLALMPDGIDTMIGEDGQTLSGGQRTRLALASTDILVLDDPLSALDMHVADNIMKEGICGDLRHKTRIIVTNAIQHLKYADTVLVMDKGKICFEGTFEEVQYNSIYQELKKTTVEQDLDDANDGDDLEQALSKISRRRKLTEMSLESQLDEIYHNEEKKPEIKNLMLDEDREVGLISFKVVKKMMRKLGGIWIFMVIFIIAAISNISDFLVQYLILLWTQKYLVDDPETEKVMWLVFGSLQLRNVLNGIRALVCFAVCVIASRKIHAMMSFRVLHSMIGEFLERTPTGRIINRFTKDLNNIDTNLTWNISSFMYSSSRILVSFGVIILTTQNYYVAIPCFIFVVVALAYQRRYMKLKREVSRLQNITNSPVIGWATAVLKSLPEVRVLKKESYVRRKLRYLINENMKNSILVFGLDYWFQTRVAFLNMLLIQIPSYGVILYQLYYGENININYLVVFIMTTSRITNNMTQLLLSISNIETNLISAERCFNYEEIGSEKGYKSLKKDMKRFVRLKKKDVKAILRNQEKVTLFSSGDVELKNLTAQYPTKSTPVLDSLNLKVKSGEKIGIVGRTGAGKTSFIKLFWRCLETKSGELLVDGKDISKLDLKQLRSEIMVITQETALFAGTLRENIEPKLQYVYDKKLDAYKIRQKEDKILNDLEYLGFDVDKLDDLGLDFEIEFEGTNLSQGEKQIVCFLRAVAEKKKLIILDEATAAIDLKTEQRIQKKIEEEFSECTMFIIAHRIQTVLSCDKILVLEDGKVREFDSPQNLIKQEDSEFYKIYQKLQKMKD